MVGFTQLTPMLQTLDVGKTIEFYTRVLGFSVTGVWPQEKPVWCSLERDGARLTFMTNDHLKDPQMTGTLYIETTDVMTLHKQLSGQVEVLWGPEIYEYGMHEFAIKDCNGYTLSFGQPVDMELTTRERHRPD
jgi:uncharacterized glyoxalase superfamily protein PhnB